MKMNSADIYKTLEVRYFSDQMDESSEVKALPKLLENVTTFVDVGAALGQYTFIANKVLRHGTIYAFEADPFRFKRLERNCREWEKTSTNKIQAIHAAVGNISEKVSFMVHCNSLRSGCFFIPGMPEIENKQEEWENISVDCISLDSVFKNFDPDLVKMDVEGAEYKILEGASNILKRGKCRFLVEVHPWGDPTIKKKPADVFNYFANYSYDFRRMERHWLFQQTHMTLKTSLKNKAVNIILNNQFLRNIVKKFMVNWILNKR